MNTSDLLNIIMKNDIAIYGAGYAAQNFYTALQIRNLERQIKCFVVTDGGKAQSAIYGIPVRKAEDVVREKNIYFCIAVHEAIKDEIEEYLVKCNIQKYVWVHPNIMEIAFGKPVECHKPIKTGKLMRSQCYDNYAFAIRYLAIGNYYKENDIGYDLYLKALCLQCEMHTAQKRLNKFINLIDNWDKNGYQQGQDILIDENMRLIDGTHRLSIACYHEMEYIYCDIFPYSDNYSKVMKESHFLSMDALKKSGFRLHELETFEKVQKKIWNN